MEQKKKKSVLPGIIALAFVCALAVFIVLLYAEKKVLSEEEKGKVIVAKGKVDIGTIVTRDNIDDYFEIKEVPISVVPEDAVDNPENMLELTSGITMGAGTIVSESMFLDTKIEARNLKKPVLLGFKAEDLYQTTCGILRTGDRVHIYIEDEEGMTILRWENVYIAQAFDGAGDMLSIGEDGKALRFNIYLEEEDVEEFYSSLDSKSLKLVKICNEE